MKAVHYFYYIKPFIPRRIQIEARRLVARTRLKKNGHIWPIDPRAAQAPADWSGWPDNKRFALVLNHDVDTAKGHENCLKLMETEQKLGFVSAFFFVPEGYLVSASHRRRLVEAGFEVGVHGLVHDGLLFKNYGLFRQRAPRINRYLREWGAAGFSSPSMHRNLDWIKMLNIEYDISTFDTDPFEPIPGGTRTIFPFMVRNDAPKSAIIELPYTLPQDHNLFIILKQKDIKTWKAKLDWIAKNGGMALLNTHPDYMNFHGRTCAHEEYPVSYYTSFLDYIETQYSGQYWNITAKQIARFWRDREASVSTLTKRASKNPEL